MVYKKYFFMNLGLILLLLLLLPDLFQGVRGMAGDHGVPEAIQLQNAWTSGCREKRSCQRTSGTKST